MSEPIDRSGPLTPAKPVPAEPAAPAPTSHHLMRTLWAVFWLYGGRGVGLLWTVLLIAHLGIADYGKYGMAYAVFSLIGPPLDNPFAVRAIRESEERFLAERTTRYLLGIGLMAAGAALIEVSYIAWFGLFVAGGEIIIKAYQSHWARDGQPQRVAQLDTIRQVASVACGAGYLFLAEDPDLQTASLWLVAPYLLIAIIVGFVVLRHRPGMPGPPKLIAILIGEMLGLAAYLQGDVLLLGWLTDDTTVGYYALTVTVTIAIVAVGQSFGMSYNRTMREGDGHLASGPPLKSTLILGAVAGLLVLIAGFVMLLTPAPRELAVAMIIMSAFCAMRTITSVFQAVLYLQRRDTTRLMANIGLLPVKLGLVALFATAGFGAVGAAVATVIADALLLAIYAYVLYRKPADTQNSEEAPG
ncbi:MAG: lipopolysaccharide biosynthesis protein [Mycobacterium sp.]